MVRTITLAVLLCFAGTAHSISNGGGAPLNEDGPEADKDMVEEICDAIECLPPDMAEAGCTHKTAGKVYMATGANVAACAQAEGADLATTMAVNNANGYVHAGTNNVIIRQEETAHHHFTDPEKPDEWAKFYWGARLKRVVHHEIGHITYDRDIVGTIPGNGALEQKLKRAQQIYLEMERHLAGLIWVGLTIDWTELSPANQEPGRKHICDLQWKDVRALVSYYKALCQILGDPAVGGPIHDPHVNRVINTFMECAVRARDAIFVWNSLLSSVGETKLTEWPDEWELGGN